MGDQLSLGVALARRLEQMEERLDIDEASEPLRRRVMRREIVGDCGRLWEKVGEGGRYVGGMWRCEERRGEGVHTCMRGVARRGCS